MEKPANKPSVGLGAAGNFLNYSSQNTVDDQSLLHMESLPFSNPWQQAQLTGIVFLAPLPQLNIVLPSGSLNAVMG